MSPTLLSTRVFLVCSLKEHSGLQFDSGVFTSWGGGHHVGSPGSTLQDGEGKEQDLVGERIKL